jgi:hypothetical protein
MPREHVAVVIHIRSGTGPSDIVPKKAEQIM